MIEIAFLRMFLAWETLLEDSFILYLCGQRPPRGRRPVRYAFPPNQKAASEWVLPERRDYAQWTDPQTVAQRAKRFFRDGKPFDPVLRGNQNLLHEARTIRNAIAHSSANTRQKLEKVIRENLKTLPINMTTGGFLSATVPALSPPISFLEHYMGKIEAAARLIIPS